MKAKNRILGVAAALALLVCAGLVYQVGRLSREEAAARARTEALGREVEALRAELSSGSAERQALREKLEAAGLEVKLPAPVRGTPHPETERLDALRQLAALQKQMTVLSDHNRELQSKTVELQGAVEKLGEENRTLKAESEEVKDSLDRTRRLVQATEAELKSKSERLAQMEGALSRLREENAGNAGLLRATSELVREYEELNRRRENYLTSLQRRYRELTDQYRATMLTIEQQRDNPMVSQLPDASRIQTTVLSAEDELRQLTALQGQAQRLSQRLRQRR